MNYENDELIKAAVDWWINKITKPKVVLPPKMINASEINEEKIQNFKIKLTNFLRLKLMVSSGTILRTEDEPIRTEDEPIEDLLKIAKIAKLDISNYDLFPWNTEMLITKNYIIVKEPDTDFEQIYNKNEKKLIKTISK